MQGKPYKPSCLRSTARLLILGNGPTYIGRLLHIDRCKVSSIRHILDKNDIRTIDGLNAMSDVELTRLIYPSAVIVADNVTGEMEVTMLRKNKAKYFYPNYKILALKRIEGHFLIRDLFDAYLDTCDRKKMKALNRSTFFAGVKKQIDDITRGEDACLTLEHEYGQDIQVDYIDKYPTLTLADGTKRDFVVFVMTWPASYFTYACFIPNHSTIQTCKGIGDGIKFFGVRSFRLCPDNAKSMVTSHKRGCESVLNPSFEDFMRRLGIDVEPTPVYSASSKSAVEYENRLIEERVFPYIEKEQNTRRTLQEWNTRLMELVNEKINRTKLHRTGKTREQLFLEYEKPAARALNIAIPEYLEVVRSVRVPRTYMVEFDGHRYSVNYRMIGELVDIRASATAVHIYHNNKLLAAYPRKSDNGFTMLREHMPENHKAVTDTEGKFTTDKEVLEASKSLSQELFAFCKHRLSFEDTQRYVACTAVIRHYRKTLNRDVFDCVLKRYSTEDDRNKCVSSMIFKDVAAEIKHQTLEAERRLNNCTDKTSTVSESMSNNGAFSPMTELELEKVNACVFSNERNYSEKANKAKVSDTADASGLDSEFDDELPF